MATVATRHFDNMELQEEDEEEEEEGIYQNVERPSRKHPPQTTTPQSDIRWYKRFGVGVGLLCAVLALLNVAVPLSLYKSNMAERDQLLASFDQLKRTLLDKPKVAFSAGLGETGGTVSSDTTLVYKRVFANVGNAYNQSTGIFTAPLKGVYHVTFTAAVYGKSSGSGHVRIHMYKNGKVLLNNFGYNSQGKTESMSNGLVVELEEGDAVCMRLPSGYRLCDNGTNNNNVFSGVLVYAM